MFFAYVAVVLAGILNTVQSGSNGTLHKASDHPIFPAVVSFGVGFLAMCALWGVHALWTKKPVDTSELALAPWWAWIGGLLGGAYVLAMVNLSQKIGAGVFIGLTVTAGVLTSLTMDHFGLMGFARHPASLPRVLGGLMMIGGLVLIGKF